MGGSGREAGRCSPRVARALAVALLAAATTVGAAPLGLEPEGADPLQRLDATQVEAARALGEARRAMEAGRPAEARRALARAESAAALSGYAEWVRVRLLLEEGRPAEAHAKATRALDDVRSDALRAALGVLQGEALASTGDSKGAEHAWRQALGRAGAEDEAVRDSVQLAIVAARQRTGSLDAGTDPRRLLDRAFEGELATVGEVPVEALTGPAALTRADEALERGRTDQALALFDRAIAGPLDAAASRRARLGRGLALFRSRSYRGAADQFSALLPDVEARFWRARSLARTGDVDGALDEFERVARGPDEELASWSLYLLGTLLEDRGERERAVEAFRRAARYERFPERVRLALWREGWARFRTGAHVEARASFRELERRLDDPLDRLRPRYWAARAAIAAGDSDVGRRELVSLAREFPLTYYGWRAAERVGEGEAPGIVRERELAEGTRAVDDRSLERAALLIAGGLDDLARDELRFSARRARGLHDRTRVGLLLARVGDYHRANQLVVHAYADSLSRGLQPGREALWWLAWPPAHRDLVATALPPDASVDRELVWAIMREESHYRAEARSVVGARGLLQLMPATAAELAEQRGLVSFEPDRLFEPRVNIALGADYLDQLGERFGGRLSAAIGSYNAGPTKVASWLRGDAAALEDDVWVESIPYDQTRAYVKRVLRSHFAYRSLYR